METSCTTRAALAPAWWLSSESIHTLVHVPRILAAATIWGWCLFEEIRYTHRLMYNAVLLVWGSLRPNPITCRTKHSTSLRSWLVGNKTVREHVKQVRYPDLCGMYTMQPITSNKPLFLKLFWFSNRWWQPSGVQQISITEMYLLYTRSLLCLKHDQWKHSPN